MHPILPERPLPLRSSFLARFGIGSVLCLVGALALTFYGGQWLWEEAEVIRRHDRIWASGEAALGSVEGQERSSHFIFYEYELKVSYTDARDVDHSGKVSFSSCWTEVDQSKTPIVHYDPSSPDDFALSWAIDLGGARWGAYAVYCFGVAMMAGLLGFFAWMVGRQLADARRCAERSDEVLLDVTSVTEQIVNGQKTGSMVYRYRLPGTGEGTENPLVTGEAILSRGAGPPLFADEEGKTMVALLSPLAPTRPLIVRRDLYPFNFTAEQAREIRERMEARRGPAFPTSGV